ncbi:MAG: hypothetical protein HY319_18350 [Armatimonadetes bacterium]|nr:hypothetical protein [Armatimonadota bacterium]
MIVEAAMIAVGTYWGAFHFVPLLRRIRLERLLRKNAAAALPLIRKELGRNGPTGHRDVVGFLLAECLFLLGDFTGAMESVRNVDPRALQRMAPMFGGLMRLLYVNGMVYFLSVGGDLAGAAALVDELHRASARWRVRSFLGTAVRDTLATFYYHSGHRTRARQLFEECLAAWPRVSFSERLLHDGVERGLAISRYYLGRLDLAEGRMDQGLARIAESARQLPGTFFAEEPGRLAHGTEWIPCPPPKPRLSGS